MEREGIDDPEDPRVEELVPLAPVGPPPETSPDLYCGRPAGWGLGPDRKHGRCRDHCGNLVKHGPENPAYKHGRHTKLAKQARLLEQIKERPSENLVEVDENLKAVDHRIEELYGQVDMVRSEDVPDVGIVRAPYTLAVVVTQAIRDIGDALSEGGDVLELLNVRERLEVAVSRENLIAQIWEEIRDLHEQRRRLTATADRIRRTESEMVTRAQMLQIVHYYFERLQTAVEQEIEDAALRAAVMSRAMEVHSTVVGE
jgi:hypothetical protein